MNPRGTLRRVKHFQIDEWRRKIIMIEKMIEEFERTDANLELEIEREQARRGICDPANFANPLFAKAATQRRENLKQSINELRSKLSDARVALAEAVDELTKIEIMDERRQMSEDNILHE
jgi:hypothetical protein